jgi:hypothetical protein
LLGGEFGLEGLHEGAVAVQLVAGDGGEDLQDPFGRRGFAVAELGVERDVVQPSGTRFELDALVATGCTPSLIDLLYRDYRIEALLRTEGVKKEIEAFCNIRLLAWASFSAMRDRSSREVLESVSCSVRFRHAYRVSLSLARRGSGQGL